ncbi:hypothetical protein HXK64_03920 [Candidatus Gracilibacteria bacterium]|nr:hypothetical protein [Candidatus Gracilibacteria bacterium]
MYPLYDFLVFLGLSDEVINFLINPYYIGLTEVYNLFNYFGLPEYSKELIDSNSYIRGFLNTVVYAFYNSGIGYDSFFHPSLWNNILNSILLISTELIGIFIGSFIIFLISLIFFVVLKNGKTSKHIGNYLGIYGIIIKIIPIIGLLSSFFIAISDKNFQEKLKYILAGSLFNVFINEMYIWFIISKSLNSRETLHNSTFVSIVLFIIFSLIYIGKRKLDKLEK